MESANGIIAAKAVKVLMEICKNIDICKLHLSFGFGEREEKFAASVLDKFQFASKYEPNLPEVISRIITESERGELCSK